MQASTEGHQHYFLAVPGSNLSLLSPPLTQAEWNLRVWSLDTQQNSCCGQLFHRGEMLKLRILSLNIQQTACFVSSFTGMEVVKLFFVMWCWHTAMSALSQGWKWWSCFLWCDVDTQPCQLFHRDGSGEAVFCDVMLTHSHVSSFTGIEVVKLFFVMWCWHTAMSALSQG